MRRPWLNTKKPMKSMPDPLADVFNSLWRQHRGFAVPSDTGLCFALPFKLGGTL